LLLNKKLKINSLKQLNLFKLFSYLLFPVLFLTPQSGIGYILQILIIFMVIFSKFKSHQLLFVRRNLNSFIKVLIFYIFFIAICYQVIIVQEPIYLKNIFKGLNIILLICLFPFNKKIYTNELVFWLILIIIGCSQIAYLFNISFFINLIDNYYFLEGYLNSSEISSNISSSESIFNLRFGGLYRNPNQCARAITFLSGFYLITRIKNKISKINILFLCFSLFFIIVTGSRTGLFIELIMIIFFAYIKYPLYFKRSLIVIIPFLIFVFFSFSDILFSSRIFDFKELYSSNSTNNSINLKLEFLYQYLQYKADFYHYFQLLFGTSQIDTSYYLGFNNNYRIENFDSDIGYIINGFGLIGLFLIASFYFMELKKIPRQYIFIFSLLLWMISSSILTNIRFSLIFAILMSHILTIRKEGVHA
tara:strand:+ start:2421 stop:3677 length:1257 start_codon:yes stop_codon:yes gene_type:complete